MTIIFFAIYIYTHHIWILTTFFRFTTIPLMVRGVFFIFSEQAKGRYPHQQHNNLAFNMGHLFRPGLQSSVSFFICLEGFVTIGGIWGESLGCSLYTVRLCTITLLFRVCCAFAALRMGVGACQGWQDRRYSVTGKNDSWMDGKRNGRRRYWVDGAGCLYCCICNT